MAVFPMPHTATLYKRKTAPSTNRAGQIVAGGEHETTGVTIKKCLFYGFSGGRSSSGREDYDQTVAFYLPAGVDIDEGDKVTNVTGPRDAFEAGPFEVLNVRYVTDLSGNVHHISCKLRGSVG